MRTAKEEQLCEETLHDYKKITHQLEVLAKLEVKWKKNLEKFNAKCKEYQLRGEDLEEALEELDRKSFEMGYMSLSLSKHYTEHRDRIAEMLVRNNPQFLHAKPAPVTQQMVDWTPQDKHHRLLCKIYAIRYPNKMLTKLWLKPYFVGVMRQASFVSRSIEAIQNCCGGSISELGNMIVSGVKHIWNTMKSTLEKYLTGKFLMLVAAIICGAVVAKLIGTWACIKIFPLVYRNERITEKTFESITDYAERQAGGSEILNIVGNTIKNVVEPVANFELEPFLQKFGKIATNINSIERLLSNVWTYLKPFLDHLYAAGNGGIPFSDEGKLIKDIERKCSVLDMYIKKKSLTRAESVMIKDLEGELRDMITVEVKHAYPRIAALSVHVFTRYKQLFEESSIVLSIAQDRVEPVWLHLVGPPGIGKTWLIDSLVMDLNTAINRTQLPAAELKYVVSDPKFFPNYRNQFAFVVDDFLQKADPVERMQEAEQMIHFSNSAVQPLPQASVEDKGKSFFTSTFIITTSNYDTKPLAYLPDNLKLKDNEAFYRRFMPVFVSREVDKDGVDGYRLRPIKDTRTLGTTHSYNDLLILLASRMKEKQREFNARQNMQSFEGSLKRVREAAQRDYTQIEKIDKELRHASSTAKTDLSQGSDALYVAATSVAERQSGRSVNDLDYMSSCSDEEDVMLTRTTKDTTTTVTRNVSEAWGDDDYIPTGKGWESAATIFGKLTKMVEAKGDDREKIKKDLRETVGEVTFPKEGDAATYLEALGGQTILTLMMYQEYPNNRLVKMFSQEACTREWMWHEMNVKQQAEEKAQYVKKMLDIVRSPLLTDDKFVMLACRSFVAFPSEKAKFDKSPVDYIEDHCGVQGAESLYHKYKEALNIHPRLSISHKTTVPSGSVQEFSSKLFEYRNASVSEAKAILGTYIDLENQSLEQLIALVGETLVSMALGGREFDSNYLNYLVYKYDVRIKIFRNWRWQTSAEIFYNPTARLSTRTFHPSALNAAILRFTTEFRGSSIRPLEEMKLITSRQYFTWKEKIHSFFTAGEYDITTSNKHPRTCIPTVEDMEKGMLLFKTKEIIEKEQRKKNYGEWIGWAVTASIAIPAVTLLLVAIKRLIKTGAYGATDKALTQSFDPTGQNRSEKSQRRIQKRARIIAKKDKVLTEGVVKQSKALDITPKVQGNTELMLFTGTVETQAYGFFVKAHTFVTVSHVFTNDVIKKIEFCFSDTGHGSLVLTRDQFDVTIHKKRELAIVTVDPRCLPAHADLTRHLPSDNPKLISDMIFIDHQASGHFLLRSCGEAKLTHVEFRGGETIHGVYSVSLTTENGDCGQPYLSGHDSVQAIRGIHIGYGSGLAYFTPVYVSDFTVEPEMAEL